MNASRTLLPLLSGLWILASQPSQAIIDTNSNTLSDLWEKSFNSNQLFPNTANFLPLADPDKDTWTNAQEAEAGTNPFNSNPPLGLVRLQITTIPAVYYTSPETGLPTLHSPATFTTTWPTLVGKQYTLLVSPDLSAGSWLPVGPPITGQGTPVTIALAPTDEEGNTPDKLFWRVAINDLDSDGDGLTDGEESKLGTDPVLSDTDGDDVADGTEAISASDPLDPDSASSSGPPPRLELAYRSLSLVGDFWIGQFHSHINLESQSLLNFYAEQIGAEIQIGTMDMPDGDDPGQDPDIVPIYAWPFLFEDEQVTFAANDAALSDPYGAWIKQDFTGSLASEFPLPEITETEEYMTWKKATHPDTAAMRIFDLGGTYRSFIGDSESETSWWTWSSSKKYQMVLRSPQALTDGASQSHRFLRISETFDDGAEELKTALLDPPILKMNFDIPAGKQASNVIEVTTPTEASQPEDEKWKRASLVHVEIVQGEPGTATEDIGNWLMAEANPSPEVTMEVTGADVSGTGVIISVKGRVTDKLSKYGDSGTERLETLRFMVGGQELHAIDLTDDVGEGMNFNETITIPNARPGGYTLRAETSENLAGNTGWDQVAVGLNLAASPASSSAAESEFSLAFTQNPSSGTVDMAKVYFGNRAASSEDLTVIETGADSSQFEGQVKMVINGQTHSVPCRVLIKGSINLAAGSADVLFAQITYTHPTLGQRIFYGCWRETGNNNLTFGSSGYQGGNDTLQVEAMTNLPGSQREDFQPITLRIHGPHNWEDSDRFSATIGGNDYPLKKFTYGGQQALYPYDPAHPGAPKQFLPSAKSVPQKLQLPGYTAGGGTFDIKVVIEDTEQLIQTIQVQRGFKNDGTPPPPGAAARSSASARPPLAIQSQSSQSGGWQEPGDAVTLKDLLDAYEWIYGTNEDAMTLLRAYLENDNLITLGNEIGDLDVHYLLRTDNKIEIEIEDNDNDINPVVCANLLHAGLYRALAYPPLNMHPDVADNINLFAASRTAFAQTAAEVTATTAEMYLSGITIVSEPLDWVLAINDASEGNYVSLAAMLPLVPSGTVKIGSKALRIRDKAGHLLGEITDPLHLGAIKVASRKRAVADKILVLETAGVSDEMIAILAKGDELLASKSRANLKARMVLKNGPGPENYQAHHDLPWEFKKRFLEAKLDVNDPQFGRWVHPDDHRRWHFENPKFNDFWEDFFYGASVNGIRPEIYRSKAEVLQKLQEARDIYFANPIGE